VDVSVSTASSLGVKVQTFAGQAKTVKGYPTKLETLTDYARFVLALVRVHEKLKGEALPPRALLSYVSSTADLGGSPFTDRDLPATLMRAIGELVGDALITTTPDGLRLSAELNEAVANWDIGPLPGWFESAEKLLEKRWCE
jgi:hypothetical protein